MSLKNLLNPEYLINTFGIIGIALVVFAESGLFVGFFLPGDSLLFTAGLIASKGTLNIWILVPTIFVAAAAGDSFGFWFGSRAGSALYRRKDSRFFKHEHLQRATDFYEKHGPKTIILARFIPIVRTFAPIVAGAAKMEYRRFLAFNLIGAGLWGIGVTVAGYVLGSAIPSIDKYLLPIIVVIVVLSVIPPAHHAWKARRARRSAGGSEPSEADGTGE